MQICACCGFSSEAAPSHAMLEDPMVLGALYRPFSLCLARKLGMCLVGGTPTPAGLTELQVSELRHERSVS